MTGGYLALHWRDSAGEAEARRIAESAVGDRSFRCVHDRRRTLILVDPDADYIAASQGGLIVVGVLFPRDRSPAAIEKIDNTLALEIAESDGDVLTGNYWGSYVAFIAKEHELVVLRDPSGAIPCLRIPLGAVECIASDIEAPVSLGLIRPAPDWREVARCLAFPMARGRATCLEGVEMVMPGTRLRLISTGTASSDYVWDPAPFALGAQAGSVNEAMERLRDEALRCVGAWASRSRQILLELSGGLDSSIVAACLKSTTSEFTCVNLSSAAAAGDERRYARAVTERLGLLLKEVTLDPCLADVHRLPEIRPVYPEQELLRELADAAFLREGLATEVDSYFSGGGGDNIFCLLGTAAPAADALKAVGPFGAFFDSVNDLAELHRCTVWTVLRLTLRKAWAPRPSYLRGSTLFLSGDVAMGELHPWLNSAAGALPGKAEHLTSVIFGLWGTGGADRSSVAPIRYPLLSQPLVELALQIPTWFWIRGGRDRSIAREAFKNDLPEIVYERRTKGDLTDFMGEVFGVNRNAIGELLLEGCLAREGVIDRSAVESCLSTPDLPTPDVYSRLLTLAKAEVWAGSWSSPHRRTSRFGSASPAIADIAPP